MKYSGIGCYLQTHLTNIKLLFQIMIKRHNDVVLLYQCIYFEHNANNLGQVVYCVASWNANKVCSLAGWPLVMKPGNVMCHLCGWEVHSYSGMWSSTKQIYLGLCYGKHELRLETGFCCQDERCEGPQQESLGEATRRDFQTGKAESGQTLHCKSTLLCVHLHRWVCENFFLCIHN